MKTTYIVDLLFLIVLVAHIIKIDYLVKENQKNKHYLQVFYEVVDMIRKEQDKANEHIKKLYDLLDSESKD